MAAAAGNRGRGTGSWWRFLMWGGAAGLLALPWVAMRFTREFDWGALDFLVFGAMLAVACGGFEVAVRLGRHWAYRAGAAVAILAGFLLVWVNLAVGLIGDEGNPANLAHAVVLLVAVGGALLARFGACGLARVMVATAVAQGLTVLLALMVGRPLEAVLTAFWVGMWLLSAGLFALAAGTEQPL